MNPLDARSQILLKTLIERHIADGQPVGSRALSRYSGLELSPATVRNVMSDLEEMGFIASPHTSAGRAPVPNSTARNAHTPGRPRTASKSMPVSWSARAADRSPGSRSGTRRRMPSWNRNGSFTPTVRWA